MKLTTFSKKWLPLVALSFCPFLVKSQVTQVADTFHIVANNDDAEENLSGGSMDLSSSDLELNVDGSKNQLVGIRFANVNIPQGSIIQNAYIQFTVDEVSTSGNVDILIGSEDIDNSPAINGISGNLSSRTWHLGDTIVWNAKPFVAINDADSNQRTLNISQLVQNSVDKVSWFSGNAIMIGMTDPVNLGIPGFSGNTGKRVAQSKNKSSSRSAKLIVEYIPSAKYQIGLFPLGKNSSWKYNDLGVSLDSVNWTAINYNDSAWAFGDAILGYGNNNESTNLDFGNDSLNKHSSYYLRNTFFVRDTSEVDSLIFNLLRDGGAVVYVNGIEAFRSNMPTGNVDYNTLASSSVIGADETAYFQHKTDNLLIEGINVLAVELHQDAPNSDDLSFDLEVGFKKHPLQTAGYPFAKGSEWYYLDNGSSLDSINWTVLNYKDESWKQGAAPLGYGNPVATEISYGPNSADKYITSYFRRSLDIDTALVPDTVQFGLRRDDGAIVYLNGIEIFRSNMPAGSVNYKTTSSTIVSGGDENTYFSYLVPSALFHHGINQLAVEIHNRDSSSSDLTFDLFIKDAPVVNPKAMGCANGQNHIACFTSIAPTSQTSNLIIPDATHAFQMLFKQGDAYTKGTGFVPGNHDFTAYVPINGSSEKGYLSVNHENSPGGVSILDLHYDTLTKLWVVDTTQAVDFYNNDLVSTVRNCSGGITPWGTVITAEESGTSSDANNDGYSDIGWLVEIDPITKEVVDYENDGIQDKLWAVGNISHENAVIANDSITLYTGEDGGSSAVFKFIADTVKNLSQGKLYALKLDDPLNGGDPTGTTGKWIPVPNSTKTEKNTTSSLAISLGATNFNGVEDIEISPIDGQIYFTAKGADRVYRFNDGDTTLTGFETFVGGTSYILNTAQGVFTESWGSGNDNLTFDDHGNLWVLQDGGNNYIWMVPPTHTQAQPKVELFASVPQGSEPTGLTFSPDYRFGFVSVQHPSGSNTAQKDATQNNVTFDKSATLVFAINSNLGNSLVSLHEEESIEEEVLVYPNPSKGSVNLEFDMNKSGEVKIEIFNLTGQKLAEIEEYLSVGKNQNLNIDLSNFVKTTQVLMLNIQIDGKNTNKLLHIIK